MKYGYCEVVDKPSTDNKKYLKNKNYVRTQEMDSGSYSEKYYESSRNQRKRKLMAVIIFIAIYLLIPTIVTLNVTGIVDNVPDEEVTEGKKVVVNYKNASQTVSVEKFITMVLADRLYMGDEVELLKAESIMIRTDIYRLMEDAASIDSRQLEMSYLTENQMKKKWSKQYEDNYNLVKDCVDSTKGIVIKCNDKYIDARYTYITSGTTLSGQAILGEDYSYLPAVECPKDKDAEDYLVVKTISNKDFVNALNSVYDNLNIDKNSIEKQIQTVSKNNDGYVVKMQAGNVVMTGSTFAKILGLNSANFKLEYMNSSVKVTTIGVGDGFGVSVYTAQDMAKTGSDYEQILNTFYTGITITTVN